MEGSPERATERGAPRGPLGARPPVRRATEADLPALRRTLARAFHDDPIARWACARDGLRPAMLERFYAIRLRQVLRHEEIWVADDAAGGDGGAADGAGGTSGGALGGAPGGAPGGALWLPPDEWRTSARDDLELARSLLHPRLLPRLPLVLYGFTGIERRHPPRPPHWYLAVLGTEPAAQGRGIGSALLAPVLERCDEDGIGAYLESSKEENIAFYARHGFRVTDVVQLPRGPRAWLMWREPR